MGARPSAIPGAGDEVGEMLIDRLLQIAPLVGSQLNPVLAIHISRVRWVCPHAEGLPSRGDEIAQCLVEWMGHDPQVALVMQHSKVHDALAHLLVAFEHIHQFLPAPGAGVDRQLR